MCLAELQIDMLWVWVQSPLYTVTPPIVTLSSSRVVDPGHRDIVTLDGHMPHVEGLISLSDHARCFNGSFSFLTSVHGILKKTLTTQSRVLLEKHTVAYLFKRFLAFYGTRSFITVFARIRDLRDGRETPSRCEE